MYYWHCICVVDIGKEDWIFLFVSILIWQSPVHRNVQIIRKYFITDGLFRFWPNSENWNRGTTLDVLFPLSRWNPSSKYGQILIWRSSWPSLSWYYRVQRCHTLFFNLHKLQSGYSCYILKEYVKGSRSSVITRLIWNHEHDAWNWLDVA